MREVLCQVRIPSGVACKHIDQLKGAPNLSNEIIERESEVVEEPKEDPVIDGERSVGAAETVETDSEREPRCEAVAEMPPEPTVEPPAVEPAPRRSARARRGQTTRFDDYTK